MTARKLAPSASSAHFAVAALSRLEETPRLHVAQVIVSQMLAALEHLTTRDGGRTGGGHAPQL